ncbi:phage tail length tape-measure protein T [Burkholderia phage vB_BpP_HN05]
MNEDEKVRLARLEERFNFIATELSEAKASRKIQYEKLEEMSQTVTQMDNRVQVVEGSLKQQAPTIEEFITIKHKVVGAGLAGKWTWAILGGIISFLFTIRGEIIQWLSNR